MSEEETLRWVRDLIEDVSPGKRKSPALCDIYNAVEDRLADVSDAACRQGGEYARGFARGQQLAASRIKREAEAVIREATGEAGWCE